MSLADTVWADIYESQLNGFRASVEQAIGAGKLSGRVTLGRSSLYKNADNVHLWNELGFLLKIAKTRWRGQCHNGNPAAVTRNGQQIDRADWTIAELTGMGLHTENGRKNAFWGPGLTGMGFDDTTPAPLALSP